MSEREQSQAARAWSLPQACPVPTYSWARTPPARLVRSGIQYGALVPLLKFIAPSTVIGKRNLSKLNGPAVFVANHQSHFDAPISLAALGGRVRRRLVVAAAADYFYSSAVKGAAASLTLGTVPFVRSGRLQPRLPPVPQGPGRQGLVGADLPAWGPAAPAPPASRRASPTWPSTPRSRSSPCT